MSKIKVYDAHIVFQKEKEGRDAFNSYDSNTYCSMLPLHSLLRNRSERRQPDLVDKVPGLQPLLRSQLKRLVVEKTIVEALLDALVVQVLPDEHQLLASVAPRPRLIIGCLKGVHILTTSILGYLPPHFLGTMPSESPAHSATLAKGVCAERIEDR